MYEKTVSNNNIPARGAKEVAIRARQQEKEMALLNAEYKAEYMPVRGRRPNFFTGMMYGLLSIFGLN